MFPVLRTAITKLVQPSFVLGLKPVSFQSTFFHTLTRTPQTCNTTINNILQRTPVSFLQVCGFKCVARVKRRCKDCFMVKRFNRWHNLCKTHPRHKQMQRPPKEKNTWILTHATQGKIRPWQTYSVCQLVDIVSSFCIVAHLNK